MTLNTRVVASTAQACADRVFAEWRRGLRKAHQEDPDALMQEAVTVLVEAGLIRRAEGALLVHAAAARYAPKAELVRPARQASLFEEYL